MLLVDLLTGISDETVKRMKNATREERLHMAKTAVEFTEIGIQMLKESPEFREAFARIHSEFLKYPESASTITEALKATNKFVSDKETSFIAPAGMLGR